MSLIRVIACNVPCFCVAGNHIRFPGLRTGIAKANLGRCFPNHLSIVANGSKIGFFPNPRVAIVFFSLYQLNEASLNG